MSWAGLLRGVAMLFVATWTPVESHAIESSTYSETDFLILQ